MRKGKEMVRHARGAALFLLACFASAARAATAIPDGESEPAHYAVLFLKLFLLPFLNKQTGVLSLSGAAPSVSEGTASFAHGRHANEF